MSPRKSLLVIVVFALMVRFGFMVWGFAGWGVLPPDTLSKVYFQQGYELAEGRGYLRHGDDGLTFPDMLHPPGLPLLVAGAIRIFGSADIPVQVLGAVLDTLAACLLYWVTAGLLGQRAGLATGMIYALYPPVAFASTVARAPEGFQALFVISTLACALQGARSPSVRSALCWFVAAGFLNGVNAYLRPDYMLLPVVLAIGLWAAMRRFWRPMYGMAIVLIVTLLLLLPWAYRNYMVCGRWVFTSSAVGVTLVGGLGEFSNPWGIGHTDGELAKDAKAQGIASPWLPEADQYFRRAFWKAVKERPGAYLFAVIKRIPMAVAAPQLVGYMNPLKTETFSEAHAKGQDRYAVVMSRPFYVIGAYWDYLAMAAISLAATVCSLIMFCVGGKGERGIIFLLLCPHLYAIGAHILTHFEPRYILPSAGCFLIGLAYVIVGGYRGGRPEGAS